MCYRQRQHLLQVAFWRFRLDRVRHRQGWGQGDPQVLDTVPQNPRDPYRGWDDFFWLDHFHGPRTIEEDWVLRALRAVNFHDRAVAQAERELQAERERRQRQIHDYEAFMANVALQGYAPRRLEREDSYSTYTASEEDPYYDDYDYRRDMESDQELPDHVLPAPWEQWMHEQEPDDHELPAHFAEVQLPVSDQSPRFETHGRAFSSDEDGDGPCVSIQDVKRSIRNCFGRIEERDDLMTLQALRERADVPPRCEICGTPCRLYDHCNFCRRGPVMHHGRCCYMNPGRRY
jgi:hypothetical protein